MPDTPFKAVGICGTSFCGSTLLGFILGSLPDCAAIGEDHAIIRGKVEPERGCSTCPRGECPIWTPEEFAAHDYASGWERFAERVGASTVIASDKVPSLYRPYLEANPERDFRPLVLYKSPEAFAVSDFKHGGRPLSEALRRWVLVYSRLFDLFAEFEVEPVGLDFLAFTESPRTELRRICKALDLEYDPSALEYWTRTHHQTAGNTAPHISLWGLDDRRTRWYAERFGDKAKIYLDNYRKPLRPLGGPLPFTRAERQEIRSDRGVARILRKLREITG